MRLYNRVLVRVASAAMLPGVLCMVALGQQGWTVVPSPNPGASFNELFGVAGTSASDVWAVGYYNSGTLAQRWDGSAMNTVASPPPLQAPGCSSSAQGGYQAVTALSSSDVWAVGYQCSLPNRPFATHWDGVTWTKSPVPLPAGTYSGTLAAVAGTSTSDVWAVGSFQTRAAEQVMYAAHWDGAKWATVPVPRPAQSQGSLYGVAATSPTDVWAVGFYWSAATQYYVRTLVEHWDGSAWSIVLGPHLGDYSGTLYGVTAISANDVWAVGDLQSTDGRSAYTLHWDGSAWSRVPIQVPQLASSTILMAVAAVSSTDIWAVGYASSGSAVEPFAQHWNGTHWMPSFAPDPGLDAKLFGVTVAGGTVWAVGSYTKTGLHYGSLQDPLTFVLRR